MQKAEFEVYKAQRNGGGWIDAHYFGTFTKGTLLYGYDVDRNSFHVYLSGGRLHLLVYKGDRVVSYEADSEWLAMRLSPNKRAYPESTDRQFADLMAARGVVIPFTTWDEQREARVYELCQQGDLRLFDRPFYAKTKEDLEND